MDLTPEKFLECLPQPSKDAAFKLGTIPDGYTSGRPTVIFDGEDAATTKTYPHLGSYAPAAGHRVLVAMVGHSGVILGKIV